MEGEDLGGPAPALGTLGSVQSDVWLSQLQGEGGTPGISWAEAEGRSYNAGQPPAEDYPAPSVKVLSLSTAVSSCTVCYISAAMETFSICTVSHSSLATWGCWALHM